MEAIVVIVLLVGGVIVATRAQDRSQRQLVSAQATARLRHLRSGEFPSSCSWCKNTALARKLFVFERTGARWQPVDLLRQLERCADAEVDALASVLIADQPRWRRICTERCAKEIFAAEPVTATEVFASCDYCSARAPAALMRCPNCGALRHDG